MKSINYFKVLAITILTLFCSCKDEEKQIEEHKEDTGEEHEVIDIIPQQEKDDRVFLYRAKANAKHNVVIYKTPSLNGEEILKLSIGEAVNIIEFTEKFEKIPSHKKYDYYGKWVKVDYKGDSGAYISGYVFDDFLDYQFATNVLPEIEKDTIIVTNEKEFVDALSSNRVVLIDAETINLESYQDQIDMSQVSTFDFYSDDEVYFSEETSFFLESVPDVPYTFALYGYSNLELRGKNSMVDIIIDDWDNHVLDFYNCSNILIDNLNFYHDAFEGACEGEVVVFDNCSNFYIQNSHFDGSGTIGNLFEKSNNFNFLNCEYYRNTDSAIHNASGHNIQMMRCDFHNNTGSIIDNVNYSEESIQTRLKINHAYITDNEVYSSLISLADKSVLQISNTAITNNTVERNIVFLQDDSEMILNDVIIKDNISAFNEYLIKFYDDDDGESGLKLNNVAISGNTDFYGFTNKNLDIDISEIENNNVFDKASDSVLTKFNSIKIKDKEYIKRPYKDLDIGTDTNTITYKNHLLKGPHCITELNKEEQFLGVPLKKDHYNVKAIGNVIEGKIDGVWEITSGRFNNDFLTQATFKNRKLEGSLKSFIKKEGNQNKIEQELNYKEGNLHGEQVFYNKSEIPVKRIQYNNGKLSGLAQYYYNTGGLREERTDVNNENGTTTYYYPNGKIESILVYVNGKVDIKKSTFFDIDNNKKDAIAYEYYLVKSAEDNEMHLPVDVNSNKYRNKVHVLLEKDTQEFLGYQYYKDGQKNGANRSFKIIDKEKNKENEETTYYKKSDYMLYNTMKNNSVIFNGNTEYLYDGNNVLHKKTRFIENQKAITYTYEGILNNITNESNYKSDDNKSFKIDGLVKKYNGNEKLVEETEFNMGKKIKTRTYYSGGQLNKETIH